MTYSMPQVILQISDRGRKTNYEEKSLVKALIHSANTSQILCLYMRINPLMKMLGHQHICAWHKLFLMLWTSTFRKSCSPTSDVTSPGWSKSLPFARIVSVRPLPYEIFIFQERIDGKNVFLVRKIEVDIHSKNKFLSAVSSLTLKSDAMTRTMLLTMFSVGWVFMMLSL